MSETDPIMRTPRRQRLARAAAILCVAVALLVALHQLIVPRLVGARVRQALAAEGWPDARFSVRRAWLFGATLDQLSPDPALTIGRGELAYSPSSLRAGRINRLSLHEASMSARLENGRIDLGTLGDRLRRQPAPGAQPPVADVPFGVIELIHSQVVLHAGQKTIALPVDGRAWRSGEQVEAELHVGEPAGPSEALRVRGRFDPAARTATVQAESPALAGTLIAALLEASGPLGQVAGEGHVAASAELDWSDDERKLSLITRTDDLVITLAAPDGPPNPVRVGGVFRVGANLAAGEVEAHLTDASLASTEWNLAAEGIRGQVRLVSINPPATAGGQSLRVARATLGQLELTDGQIVLRADPAGPIVIEQTSWHALGGSVSSEDIRIDPGSGAVELELLVRNMEVESLLKLMAAEHAEGEGRVSGRLALRVDWPYVTFQHGVLAADPGGRLRIKDTQQIEAIAEQAAAAAAGRAAQSDTAGDASAQQQVMAEVRRQVTGALADFELQSLTVDLVREEGGAVASIRAVGHGRADPRQTIDYTLNLRGIEDALDTLLLVRRRMSQFTAQ